MIESLGPARSRADTDSGGAVQTALEFRGGQRDDATRPGSVCLGLLGAGDRAGRCAGGGHLNGAVDVGSHHRLSLPGRLRGGSSSRPRPAVRRRCARLHGARSRSAVDGPQLPTRLSAGQRRAERAVRSGLLVRPAALGHWGAHRGGLRGPDRGRDHRGPDGGDDHGADDAGRSVPGLLGRAGSRGHGGPGRELDRFVVRGPSAGLDPLAGGRHGGNGRGGVHPTELPAGRSAHGGGVAVALQPATGAGVRRQCARLGAGHLGGPETYLPTARSGSTS